MVGTAKQVTETTVKQWQFAQTEWYCFACGIVSATDVKTEKETDETGFCRCGEEICKSTF